MKFPIVIMAVGIMEVGVCVEFGILDGKKHND